MHFFVRDGETKEQAIERFRRAQTVSALPNPLAIADKVLAIVGKKDNVQSDNIIAEANSTEIESAQEKIDDILGEEFKGYKGQDAVNKLLLEKRGHVKGAFYRDDIGDIDLLWGNSDLGLNHILERRNEQGINAIDFVKDLAYVVENGQFEKKNKYGNFEFRYGRKIVIIAPEYHGNKITYILTAYKTRAKKPPQ